MKEFEDRGHHGGMPGADYLRWAKQMERDELVAKYGEDAFPVRMPNTGTINNFRSPIGKGESMAQSLQTEIDYHNRPTA